MSEYVRSATALNLDDLESASEIADRSVKLAPSDPESHYARGLSLLEEGSPAEAITEFRHAAELRPSDYKLWLQLGSVCEENGRLREALTAFDRAVRRAPAYAQPRWHFGNLLLRTGQTAQAFEHLRRAAESDPSLLPALVELAWGLSQGDPEIVSALVQPQTTQWKMAVARNFAKHEKTAEALAIFRITRGVSDEERDAFMTELLTEHRFSEAHEVWNSNQDGFGNASKGSLLADGGFEGDIKFNKPGFGWQIASNSVAVKALIDKTERRAGSSSLRLDWNGGLEPNAAVLSQTVFLKEPGHYRLRFAAQAREVVTAAPIIIVVAEGVTNSVVLASSPPLRKPTTGWEDYSIEFFTSKRDDVLRLSIQRQSCPNQQCPIFGSIWLDEFVLERLSPN